MLEVEISRYCPEKDAEPYLQNFTVPLDKGVTVLGVLEYIRRNLDESLAYKVYCTNQHCGECGVRLNGKPVLACHEIITTDQVVLKPLARLPIVKDLVVDGDRLLRRLWAGLPPLAGKMRNTDFLTEEEQHAFFLAGGCIGCSICQSVCPLFHEQQDVIAGPAFYVALSQYLFRRTTEEELKSLLFKAVEHDLLKCTACGNCSKNCPKAIDPVKIIATIAQLIRKNTDIPVDNQKLLKECQAKEPVQQ